MKTPTKIAHLPEVLLTEILARLPFRVICRFKSVSKTWKSILESLHFRRLFLSLQRNSNSSWSLMSRTKELIGFLGDLPNSPASFIPPSFKRRPYSSYNFNYKSSSNGLVLIFGPDRASYVGNPVLHQWVKIPSPPDDSTSAVFAFVTRVDEDGVVLSFKVVRLASYKVTSDYLSCNLRVLVFSSETGVWDSKLIHCPYQITNMFCMNLNGAVYFSHLSEPGVLVSLDFYSESNPCRVVHFPDHHLSEENPDPDFRRVSLTTSGGFLVYMKTLAQMGNNVFKAWKLINDESWQLLWEIRLPVTDHYAPMAMHPFDTETVYLWSQQNRHLVSCNLRRQSYTILNGDQGCFINQFVCEKYIDKLWNYNYGVSLLLLQFAFPRWMESLPCPPQAELIDTTSLLSDLASSERDGGYDFVRNY